MKTALYMFLLMQIHMQAMQNELDHISYLQDLLTPLVFADECSEFAQHFLDNTLPLQPTEDPVLGTQTIMQELKQDAKNYCTYCDKRFSSASLYKKHAAYSIRHFKRAAGYETLDTRKFERSLQRNIKALADIQGQEVNKRNKLALILAIWAEQNPNTINKLNACLKQNQLS